MALSPKRLREVVDLRDVHCYGGILLVGIGCSFYSAGAGLVAMGVALFYLALRKVS